MTPDDRLADLLERWENAESNGERPTPEVICKDTPDDLPAFRALLRQLGVAGLVIELDRKKADDKPAGFRAGRYTAIEFHAAGGLGLVFRAKDSELNRDVALKCMRSATNAESPSGRRFLQEAEITSLLEHPGIAPVHGRGKTDDGRPFYTMRFIDGETLQDATRRYHAPSAASARERNVELRRLLRAFVGVCETVAYAHSRDVIHRDLKPSNVMVGPFGEVLVMDWGLAKSTRDRVSAARSVATEPYDSVPPSDRDTPTNNLDSSIDLTIYGRAKGSPSFMSPEQARGEWDKVGPASDIYSLGSTLYYVLTGKTPYDGRSSAEVVAKVREGVFPQPRSLNSQIDAALDAICRKAMSSLPVDRYASAKALADDVERWLADEPVSAWREPWSVRVRRWARRHQTFVTSSSAAFAVGVVLLAVYGYRLDRKNDDLQQSNEREIAARKEAEDRKKLADERFQLALGSAAVTATDIQTKLIRSPGTRALRESLLKDAIARLEELIRKADETRDANRTAIGARLRLGDLYRDVEQNPTKASAEYQRALELANAVLEQYPSHPLVKIDLIDSIQRMGRVQVQLGRFRDAAQSFADAQLLIDQSGSLAGEQAAKNLALQADLSLETGDAPGALDRFSQARALWSERVGGGNDDAAIALADVILSQGQAAERSGRFPEAIAHFTTGMNQWTELSKKRPADVTILRKLAMTHYGLSQAYLQLGDAKATAIHLREFLDRTRTLADQDPQNAEAVLELAMAYNALAVDAIQRFDLKVVEENSDKLYELIERLARIDLADLNSRRNYARALGQFAALARARQKPAVAAEKFQQAIGVCREILKVAPDRTTTIAELADWLRDVGLIYLRQLGKKEDGQTAMTESIQLWNKLIETDSSNLKWQVRRLDAYQVLARWQKAQIRNADADATYRAALVPIDRLAPGNRDVGAIRRAAGLLRADLAANLFEQSKKDEAVAELEKEIERLDGEARDHPMDSFVWELLDRNHTLLAELYTRLKKSDRSAAHRQKAIDACKRGLELDERSSVFRRNLQLHLAHLAEQRLTRDPPSAVKLLEEALTHSPRFPPDLAETSILRTSFAAIEAKSGDCSEMLNNPKAALEHYKKVLDHHSKVAEIEPNGPGIPGILAYDHRRMAEIRLYLLDFDGAVADYEKAKEIIAGMRADKKPLRPLDQQTESLVKVNLPFAKTLPQGIETLDAALKQPEAVRLDALRIRAAWLIAANKMSEAAATAERMTEEKSVGGDQIARAAEVFARLINADKANGAKHQKKTIELLKKAKAAGYFRSGDDIAWLDWEPLFAPVRSDPEYQSLVKELRSNSKE